MSTHYLIDLFDDSINDVITAQGTPPTSAVTGNYVVRVDDGVPVRNPTTLADLLSKKYLGLLGTHGLYTQIAYDDMLDPISVNYTLSTGIFSGFKGSVGIYPLAAGNPVPALRTINHPIVWVGPGVGPVQALLVYELFEYVDTDVKDDPFQRSYREVTPDADVSVEVSFNSGASFLTVLDSDFFNIPLADRGASLTLRFTRLTDASVRGRVFVGSWAVLY
jgi:hypothetical protein